MVGCNRSARINVKVLVILVLVLAAIGVSLFAARHVRRRLLLRMDLNAGQTAYDKKDWPAAYRHFQEYLGRNPDDLEILKKYAEARMHTPAPDLGHIRGAIAAYRRIIQVDPNDEATYEQLAKMYTYTGQFDELRYIAGMRKDQEFPDDRKWPLWKATALFRLDKMDDPNIAALEEFVEKLDPAKHADEYVQACTLRSEIILSDDSDDSPQARQNRAKKALEFLDKAVNGVPESAEALATRARFYRASADIPGMTEDDRLTAARADLDAADKIGTDDARIRSALCAEWLAHGELDKAAAELQAVENVTQEVMEEHFLDVNDWNRTRFILKSEVARQKGDPNEMASLADEALAVLKEKRHRVDILDDAVISYVTAGRPVDANSCLTEYIEATRGAGLTTQGRLRKAYLQALVARAQGRPYAVIDILQPVLIDDVLDSGLWRLLAEAYARTNQPSRASSALDKYLRLNPDDSQAMLQLAEQYLRLGDWSNVFKFAQRAESLDSADIVAKLLRIEAAIRLAAEQGQAGATQLKKLSDELAVLRQEHPDRGEIRTLQAIIALNTGQSGDAEAELKMAIDDSEGPLKLRAEMQLARYYYGQKRMADAISTCKTACDRDPDVAEPWQLLATYQAASGDPNLAHGTIEQGLAAVVGEGEKRALTIELAALELARGKVERAKGIKRLTDLAEADKKDMRARTLLLGAREILAEDPNCAQQLVDDLKAAEGVSGIRWRFHQASLWLSSDDWRSKQSEITDALQYCIDAEPKWSAPALLLGEMYNQLKDMRRAEQVYRRALAVNPAAVEVADRLTGILAAQGKLSDPNEILDLLRASPAVENALDIKMALSSRDYDRAIRKLKDRLSDDDQDANSRIVLARLVYLRDKDFDQAEKYLEAAEAIDPNSMVLVAAKVAICKADGQAEKARQVLDDCVTRTNAFSAYMLRAAYLAGEGELEDAEKDYQKLTELPDQGAVAYGLLSNFYAANGDVDKGVETLQKGLDAYPEDLSLERALMTTLFRRNREQDQDQDKALEILGKLERQLPQDIELMRIRVSRLLAESTSQSIEDARRSIEDARQKLERIVELDPTVVEAHSTLIGMAMQRGDQEAARKLAIRAVNSNPDDSTLLSIRSGVELATGNTQLAAQLARVAIKKDPNSLVALGALVDAARRSENQSLLEEARGLIESGLIRNPAEEKLVLYRAHVLASLKLPETAIPELETYCQTEEGSRSVVAIVTLADLHRLSGDFDKAEQKIEQAEQLDPNSQTVINARMGLASTLYQKGDAERAKQIYQELRDRHADKYPENIRIFNDLAWIIQEHDSDYATALDLAGRGLSAAQQDGEKLHLLDTRGTILFKMDRFDEAKADFEKLVALSGNLSRIAVADPTLSLSYTRRQAKALLQLGRTCEKLNDLDEAKEHLQKASEIDQKINVFTPEERSYIAGIIQR